ncbi:hypothetical protein ARMGADRAFT_1029428 [Armillaria gallica]|uniref:Uncharacterized protein n=1 Tax=Armillaria gallica TaxID=47427 RepID=A0A2H3DYV8_ARMGA|nr:hypothetical protein ARMGADRAFT_1029428 [Armillaria gallica]
MGAAPHKGYYDAVNEGIEQIETVPHQGQCNTICSNPITRVLPPDEKTEQAKKRECYDCGQHRCRKNILVGGTVIKAVSETGMPIELDDNDERVGKGFSLRHSTDADDPQISEQISEKIPADVAVPGYPDPWHPDPPDADMTLVTCNIRGYSIYFGICLTPHLQNGHPRVLEVEDLGSGVGFTLGGHPDP